MTSRLSEHVRRLHEFCYFIYFYFATHTTTQFTLLYELEIILLAYSFEVKIQNKLMYIAVLNIKVVMPPKVH